MAIEENSLILIPARYASTRFPGKPLVDIAGKPMIQHVYEKAAVVSDHVYVATDDKRIYDAVLAFGGCAVMTSRCASEWNGSVLRGVHESQRDVAVQF